MKRLLLLIALITLSRSVNAQLEVKQGSFKEVPGFVIINRDILSDDNDVPYAILKVKTENINDKQRRELLFQGDAATFIECEYKVGEVWVYLTYKATYLKISHPDFSSTEFWFPFDMEPRKGYELALVFKPYQPDIGYITVTSVPKGADVYIDNIKVGITPYLSENISIGNHKVSVSLEGYETMAKRVDIKKEEAIEVLFELSYETSNISLEMLKQRALELCRYVPDHEFLPEAKHYMTDDFYTILHSMYKLYDDVGYGNGLDWLISFVTGNGGSIPEYEVIKVELTDQTHAIAFIHVRQKWIDDGTYAEPTDYDNHLLYMEKIGNNWLMSDFDGYKLECIKYLYK